MDTTMIEQLVASRKASIAKLEKEVLALSELKKVAASSGIAVAFGEQMKVKNARLGKLQRELVAFESVLASMAPPAQGELKAVKK